MPLPASLLAVVVLAAVTSMGALRTARRAKVRPTLFPTIAAWPAIGVLLAIELARVRGAATLPGAAVVLMPLGGGTLLGCGLGLLLRPAAFAVRGRDLAALALGPALLTLLLAPGRIDALAGQALVLAVLAWRWMAGRDATPPPRAHATPGERLPSVIAGVGAVGLAVAGAIATGEPGALWILALLLGITHGLVVLAAVLDEAARKGSGGLAIVATCLAVPAYAALGVAAVGRTLAGAARSVDDTTGYTSALAAELASRPYVSGLEQAVPTLGLTTVGLVLVGLASGDRMVAGRRAMGGAAALVGALLLATAAISGA